MYQVILLFFIFITATAAHGETVVKYTDRLNRTVEINAPVQRVVFIQMYELLPALDAWEKVAGVAEYARRNEVIRAAKPDIDTVPSVGNGWNINVEAIMKLEPDLVITWAAAPKSISFMEEKGLKTVAVYPESISELYEVMQLLGRLLSREENMEAAKAEMEKIFSLIRDRVSRRTNHDRASIQADSDRVSIQTDSDRTSTRAEEKKRKMLYLTGQPNNVSCALGVNNDLLNLIGGVNPAGGIQERSTLVSLEQIVIWNPEVIFIWGNAGYTAEDLIDNMQWRHIRAIREKRVYKLPDWTTWGPRLPLIALYMAKKASPEKFSDIDFSEVADRLYQKVFHIPYQSEDAP